MSLFPFQWQRIASLWLGVTCGTLTRVLIRDDPSHLVLAAVLPEVKVGWRVSLLLGSTHTESGGFSTCEAAQLYAEHLLYEYIQQSHLLAQTTPTATFDDPLHEVAAQLVTILDPDMQISHISAYRREWVAVCVDAARTRSEDYVFCRDSNGILGERIKEDRLAIYEGV